MDLAADFLWALLRIWRLIDLRIILRRLSGSLLVKINRTIVTMIILNDRFLLQWRPILINSPKSLLSLTFISSSGLSSLSNKLF